MLVGDGVTPPWAKVRLGWANILKLSSFRTKNDDVDIQHVFYLAKDKLWPFFLRHPYGRLKVKINIIYT